MSKNEKNHAQRLTKKYKITLDKVVHNYSISLILLAERYPKPKTFAKTVERVFSSKNKTALLNSINLIQHDIITKSFKPHELNSALASYINPNLHQFLYDQTLYEINLNYEKFVSSSAFKEKVLSILEKIGIIENIQGKKNYKKYCRQHKGKKTKKTAKDDLVGRPSIYFVSKDIGYLSKILENPKSLEYLQNKIIYSGIMEKFSDYFKEILTFIAKSGEDLFLNYMNYCKRLMFNQNLNQEEEESFKKFSQGVQRIDDNDVKSMLKNSKNEQSNMLLINDVKYYKLLTFLYFFKAVELLREMK
jgi:hypothetical protein